MDRMKLKSIVKYVKPLYRVYNLLGNACICLLKIFVKSDDKLILFISFGGKKYDDSPKAIYETMCKDERFKEYSFVWAFEKPSEFEVPGAKKIKVDTLTYYLTALSARVWITNSTVERGLNFKGKHTLYFDTWHGTPIKKMGSDIADDNKSFKMRGAWPVDIMTAQSEYEADIFSRVFNIPRNKFILCGLPRNDILANYSKEYRDRLRITLGIPDGKKVILYMPTFREYEKDDSMQCVLTPPLDLQKWERALGENYVFLFRAHYEVAKAMDIQDNCFIQNVTNYPSLEHLMIVSDILISDYSSAFFDYSIMDKPMLYFTYDYDEYASKRGMYFDIRELLHGANNEDDLIQLILKMNDRTERDLLTEFRLKYVNYYGTAVKQSIDRIHSEIKMGN